MMVSFRKYLETDSIIIYEMASITTGLIQINKETHEITFLKLDPDEDKEELKGIIKDKIIAAGFPEETMYAAG